MRRGRLKRHRKSSMAKKTCTLSAQIAPEPLIPAIPSPPRTREGGTELSDGEENKENDDDLLTVYSLQLLNKQLSIIEENAFETKGGKFADIHRLPTDATFQPKVLRRSHSNESNGNRKIHSEEEFVALFLKSQLRLEFLWEELKVPYRDRDYFLSRYCKDATVENLAQVKSFTKFLLEHRRQTQAVLQAIRQREMAASLVLDLCQLFHERYSQFLDEGFDEASAQAAATDNQFQEEVAQAILQAVKASLLVLERLQSWRRLLWWPRPFFWKGSNYPEKMLWDLTALGAPLGLKLLESCLNLGPDSLPVLLPTLMPWSTISHNLESEGGLTVEAGRFLSQLGYAKYLAEEKTRQRRLSEEQQREAAARCFSPLFKWTALPPGELEDDPNQELLDAAAHWMLLSEIDDINQAHDFQQDQFKNDAPDLVNSEPDQLHRTGFSGEELLYFQNNEEHEAIAYEQGKFKPESTEDLEDTEEQKRAKSDVIWQDQDEIAEKPEFTLEEPSRIEHSRNTGEDFFLKEQDFWPEFGQLENNEEGAVGLLSVEKSIDMNYSPDKENRGREEKFRFQEESSPYESSTLFPGLQQSCLFSPQENNDEPIFEEGSALSEITFDAPLSGNEINDTVEDFFALGPVTTILEEDHEDEEADHPGINNGNSQLQKKFQTFMQHEPLDSYLDCHKNATKMEGLAIAIEPEQSQSAEQENISSKDVVNEIVEGIIRQMLHSLNVSEESDEVYERLCCDEIQIGTKILMPHPHWKTYWDTFPKVKLICVHIQKQNDNVWFYLTIDTDGEGKWYTIEAIEEERMWHQKMLLCHYSKYEMKK